MRKRNLTFGVKLGISTGVFGALLIAMALAGLHTLNSVGDILHRTVDVNAHKLRLAEGLNTAESDMEVAQRGVVLFAYAKNPSAVASSDALFQESSGTLRRMADELRPLLETEHGRALLDDITTRVAAWTSEYPNLRRLVDAGDLDGATRIVSERLMPQYQAVGKSAAELVKTVEGLMAQDGRDATDAADATRWLTLLLICGGCVAAAFAAWMVVGAARELRTAAEEVMDGSRQVAAAAGQVASASQSLAQGTSEQAATLEETSSSAIEITAVTRKNADNTRTVTSLMVDANDVVSAANRNLADMVHSMAEINASSDKISKIIRVIDEIAFQTNILALNAAVEAARAGEAGMGFAVVADEVRNLAHRSAQAAKDTTALIEESIGKSNEGSRKLGLVAQSIQQITASAAQMKTLVDEIDVGSQEQARGIEQISMAVGQMETVTQRNAANAEESAAASEELAAQARGLFETVERLRRIAGSGHSEVAGAPARKTVDEAKVRPPSAHASLGTAVADAREKFPLDEDPLVKEAR